MAIPPLESGDRLTRAEFERRYQASSDDVSAELIDVLNTLQFGLNSPEHRGFVQSLAGRPAPN